MTSRHHVNQYTFQGVKVRVFVIKRRKIGGEGDEKRVSLCYKETTKE
jgi:hypothetical protein